MIYQTKSSKTIIGKVFRDLGIQDSDWIDDAIEWIGEALEHIGTYSQTTPKISVVETANFRTSIPSDLYILDKIRYSNSVSTTAPAGEEFNFILSRMDSEHHPSLFETDNPNVGDRQEGYILDGSFIKTTFESKWVAISYRAFNLDADGYPNVPDAASFSEALFWYITMKILLRGFQHPVVQYQDAEQRWLKYCTQARNEYNMPDKDDYRTFRSKWVQMIPRYDRDINDLYENLKQPTDFTTNYQRNSQ